MGSKKSETKQTNEPPAWARPLFQQAAGDAQALYDSKTGYNTYTGPTQAPLSDQTLGGMNNALAATGFTGSPVTNQSINSQIPDVFSIMQQAMANKRSQQPVSSGRQGGDLIFVEARGGNGKGYYIERPFDRRTGEYLSDEEAIQRELGENMITREAGGR